MTELPLIALGGLLGSSHCVGMCGGFALSLGAGSPTWRHNLLRQTSYGLGRIFTYSSLGAAAGYGGQRLVASTTLFDAQALLAVLAGVLLLLQGTHAAGVWSWVVRMFAKLRKSDNQTAGVPELLRPGGAAPVCRRRGLIGSLLTTPGTLGPMLAGVMTGFLPCGLVYAMLALAVSGGSFAGGALTMACFGLGTLPVMTALGLGTSLMGLATRRRMFRLAAWCVVAAGCMSLVRGTTAWSSSSKSDGAISAPACPLCRESKPAGA